MRFRPAVSLFPFLSILVGALGVVAFMTMTLTYLGSSRADASAGRVPVQAEWEGAPAYVRPVLLECRADGVTLFDGKGTAPRFFTLDKLTREAAIVRDLHERGAAQAGSVLTRDQEWLFYKAVIERDQRLKDSLTLALHLIEMGNLRGDSKTRREERYPILLVAADGLESYDLAATLVESTSRLTVGVEPLLAGWRVRPGDGKAALPSAVPSNAVPNAAPPAPGKARP